MRTKNNSRIDYVTYVIKVYTKSPWFKDIKSTDWSSIFDVWALWRVHRETHLSRCDQSLFTNHTIFHTYILTILLPYSCGGLLGSKGVNKKWSVANLLTGCYFTERLSPLWKVVSIWKVVPIPKGCDLCERLPYF